MCVCVVAAAGSQIADDHDYEGDVSAAQSDISRSSSATHKFHVTHQNNYTVSLTPSHPHTLTPSHPHTHNDNVVRQQSIRLYQLFTFKIIIIVANEIPHASTQFTKEVIMNSCMKHLSGESSSREYTQHTLK